MAERASYRPVLVRVGCRGIEPRRHKRSSRPPREKRVCRSSQTRGVCAQDCQDIGLLQTHRLKTLTLVPPCFSCPAVCSDFIPTQFVAMIRWWKSNGHRRAMITSTTVQSFWFETRDSNPRLKWSFQDTSTTQPTLNNAEDPGTWVLRSSNPRIPYLPSASRSRPEPARVSSQKVVTQQAHTPAPCAAEVCRRHQSLLSCVPSTREANQPDPLLPTQQT